MTDENIPPQFEYLFSDKYDTKVNLTGNDLLGDLSHSTLNTFNLLPRNMQEHSIIVVRTGFQSIDNSGNFLEAQTDLVLYAYKYQHYLETEDIYGIICFATIQNYGLLKEAIKEKGIMHNNKAYEPAIIVPSFKAIKSEIIRIRNKVYGEQ